MTIQLYHSGLSSASRVIQIVIRLLGLNVDEKCLDITKDEHLIPQFTALNPFHMLPTLVDGDFILWQSWAILIYLVETYAPGSSLYPTDLKIRATVNRWLNWDACTLNTFLSQLYKPLATYGRRAGADEYERFDDKLQDLDRSLVASNYLTGDKMTIADIAIAVNVKLIDIFDLEIETYENISKWLERCENDLTSSLWKTFVEEPTVALKHYYTAGTWV